MSQKWFWGTFIFLFLSSTSVISWALISSPLKFEPQIISHFDNDLNGQKQKTDIWVNPGRLADLIPLIEAAMAKNNWEPVNDNQNLNAALLGPVAKEFDLSDQLQIKVFKKDGIYRTVGLLQSRTTEATYGVTSDIPKIAFDDGSAKSNWTFPIPPPMGQTLLFNVKLRNTKIGLILFPVSEAPFKAFLQSCSEKGYTQNLEREEKDKKVFLLTNKKNRILAVFSHEDLHNCISLAQID